MHALVDHEPTLLSDTDAIVRVDAVTTCHEAVGTVERAGARVKTIEAGDRVLVSGIRCRDTGTFAERVRVPLADMSTCKVPEGVTDGEALALAAFFRRAMPSSAAA